MTPDLSVVLTAHREGALLRATAESLAAAVEQAASGGVVIEIVAVLDRADAETVAAVERAIAGTWAAWPSQTIRLDVGDPGLARNAGVAAATGRLIAFVDADDLLDPGWLSAAVAALPVGAPAAIVRPEILIAFGATEWAWRLVASTDPAMDPFMLAETNLWHSFCVTTREFAARAPFVGTSRAQGFGFEDWHWNCEALAAGAEHLVLPRTAFFYRVKRAGSRLHDDRRSLVVIPPTTYLESPSIAAAIARRNAPGRAPEWVPVRPSASTQGRLGRITTGIRRRSPRLAAVLVGSYERLRDLGRWIVRPSGELGPLFPTDVEADWLMDAWTAAGRFDAELGHADRGRIRRIRQSPPTRSLRTDAYWEALAAGIGGTQARPEMGRAFILDRLRPHDRELVLRMLRVQTRR